MGSASSLADATAQQLRAAAAELSPEQRQKLRSALEILEAELGRSDEDL